MTHVPLFTVDDLCAYLRVSRRQVYKLVAEGELRTVRVGERLRFRPADVDDYLERNTERNTASNEKC